MDNLISLITLYNPSVEHFYNVKKIAQQSTYTILIDNSDKSNIEVLKNVGMPDNMFYCPNFENLGLSKAFNKVLSTSDFYKWKSNDFVAFFDQDSVIEKGHLKKLVDEYKYFERRGVKIGCIGPVYYDLSHNCVRIPRLYKRISNNSIAVDCIMTSSMVSRYNKIKEVGYWSEDVFLDMADWDICWKMKMKNNIVVMTKKSMLTHKVGDGSKKIGFITLDIGKPFREYYSTRDCIYLLRKKYIPLKYRIRFHLQLTVRPLLHLLFLENKEERVYYIKLGVKHAKKNINGCLKKEYYYKNNTKTL